MKVSALERHLAFTYRIMLVSDLWKKQLYGAFISIAGRILYTGIISIALH